MTEQREEQGVSAQRRLFEEVRAGTPRARRATRFADSVLNMMRDFLPRDRECYRRVYDHVIETAFASNAAIMNVPPEWDALDKLQLERAMLEAKSKPIVFEPFDTPGPAATSPHPVEPSAPKPSPLDQGEISSFLGGKGKWDR